MATVSEVPLLSAAQTFNIQLGTVTYQLSITYREADQGGWVLDIADASGETLVAGIPLVTGTDLLGQYAYLGLGGSLYVRTDGDSDTVPTYANLGQAGHLYWVA